MSVIPVDEPPGARTSSAQRGFRQRACAGARCVFCRSNEATRVPEITLRRCKHDVDRLRRLMRQTLPGAGRRRPVAAPLWSDDATAMNGQAALPVPEVARSPLRGICLVVTGTENMAQSTERTVGSAGHGGQIPHSDPTPRALSEATTPGPHRAQQEGERAAGGPRGRGPEPAAFFCSSGRRWRFARKKQRAGRMRDNGSRRTPIPTRRSRTKATRWSRGSMQYSALGEG